MATAASPRVLVKNTFIDIDVGDLPDQEEARRHFTAPPLGRSDDAKQDTDGGGDDNASEASAGEDDEDAASGAGEELDDLPERPDFGRLRTATVTTYEKHESWGWAQQAGFSMDAAAPMYNSWEQQHIPSSMVMQPVTMVMQPVTMVMQPVTMVACADAPAIDGSNPAANAPDPIMISPPIPAAEGYAASQAAVPGPTSATLTATASVSSNCFRVRWNADARKLSGNDKRVVSPVFEVYLGPSYPSVPCRLLLHPKVINEGKGGGCFRKAKGKGFIQLKCEQKLAQNASEIAIRFSIGADASSNPQNPPRGPVRHNFFSNAICGLPKDQDEWNFASAVDKDTQTFAVCLEIVA